MLTDEEKIKYEIPYVKLPLWAVTRINNRASKDFADDDLYWDICKDIRTLGEQVAEQKWLSQAFKSTGATNSDETLLVPKDLAEANAKVKEVQPKEKPKAKMQAAGLEVNISVKVASLNFSEGKVSFATGNKDSACNAREQIVREILERVSDERLYVDVGQAAKFIHDLYS